MKTIQWYDDMLKRKSLFGILNSSYLYVFAGVTLLPLPRDIHNKQDLFFTNNTTHIPNKNLDLVVWSTNKMRESLLGWYTDCGYFADIQASIIHKAGNKWNIYNSQQQLTIKIQ